MPPLTTHLLLRALEICDVTLNKFNIAYLSSGESTRHLRGALFHSVAYSCESLRLQLLADRRRSCSLFKTLSPMASASALTNLESSGDLKIVAGVKQRFLAHL